MGRKRKNNKKQKNKDDIFLDKYILAACVLPEE